MSDFHLSRTTAQELLSAVNFLQLQAEVEALPADSMIAVRGEEVGPGDYCWRVVDAPDDYDSTSYMWTYVSRGAWLTS